MDASAYTALPWAFVSANLRAQSTSAVGLSFFLLVSIRVGNRRLCVDGYRLSQTEDLGVQCEPSKVSKGKQAGSNQCCPAAVEGEDATRRQHTGALHKGGFMVRVVLRS